MEKPLLKPILKNVLVIDDNKVDRYIVKRIMHSVEFAEEVIEKESSSMALDYLKSLENTPEELPQFIFLDIKMPQMDGFAFLDEYAKLTESVKSACIIIMLSSSLDPTDQKRAEDSPYVSDFLNKPLIKEKIIILKEEFLANKRK